MCRCSFLAPSHRALGTVLCILFLCLLGVRQPSAISAQEEEKTKPEQTGLVADQLRFVHEGEPAFAFDIPKKKKKFAAIREKWRFVDLSVRKAKALKDVEEALEKEKSKETPDEERLADLNHHKSKLERLYEQLKVRLEVDGDPDEWIEVQVAEIAKDADIAKVGPRGFAASAWRSVDYLVERDVTSKRLRKKGGEHHHFELKGEDHKGVTALYRMDVYLVFSKDRKTRYRVLYRHQRAASKSDKASSKAADLLFSCVRMAGV